MDLSNLLNPFKFEAEPDILKARWYVVAAATLAAAGAGADIPRLYCMCTDGLDLEKEKLVQRRFKEAILKVFPIIGGPRCFGALLPLFKSLKDEQIDHHGPRWEALQRGADPEERRERGRRYFDTLWTPEAAQANRDQIFKYQPDLYLLVQTFSYEWWLSEDSILSNVESQMCTTAALCCINSPTIALWHTRGLVRMGGSLAEAKYAQKLGVTIANAYGCETGEIVSVDEIDFSDATPH